MLMLDVLTTTQTGWMVLSGRPVKAHEGTVLVPFWHSWEGRAGHLLSIYSVQWEPIPCQYQLYRKVLFLLFTIRKSHWGIMGIRVHFRNSHLGSSLDTYSGLHAWEAN